MYMFVFRNLTNIGESDYLYRLDFLSLEEAEAEAENILMDYIKNDKYLSAKLEAITRLDGTFDKDDFFRNNFFISFYELIDDFDSNYYLYCKI